MIETLGKGQEKFGNVVDEDCSRQRIHVVHPLDKLNFAEIQVSGPHQTCCREPNVGSQWHKVTIRPSPGSDTCQPFAEIQIVNLDNYLLFLESCLLDLTTTMESLAAATCHSLPRAKARLNLINTFYSLIPNAWCNYHHGTLKPLSCASFCRVPLPDTRQIVGRATSFIHVILFSRALIMRYIFERPTHKYARQSSKQMCFI